MTDIKPRDYLTGIIIFTILIIGVISLIDLARQEDDSFIDAERYSEFRDAFNKSDELRDSTSALESRVNSQETENPETNFINILFGKGFSILSSLFTTFTFTEAIITSTSSIFGIIIPSWLPPLIIFLITVMIIFSIVAAILQRDV